MLVFTAPAGEDTGPPRELFISNIDGSGVRQLTFDGGHKKGPDWSPDGSQIAYLTVDGEDAELFLINSDGTAQRQLTDANGVSLEPVWSQDSDEILFYSNRDGAKFQMYAMSPDGSNVRRIRQSDANDIYPQPLHDGRIVFASDQDHEGEFEYDIYVINADGSELKRITNQPGIDWAPSVSPEGRRIVFMSNRDDKELSQSGGYNIYLVNPDGSGLRRLTDSPDQELFPRWLPSGREIVFQRFPAGDPTPNGIRGLFRLSLDENAGMVRIRFERGSNSRSGPSPARR